MCVSLSLSLSRALTFSHSATVCVSVTYIHDNMSVTNSLLCIYITSLTMSTRERIRCEVLLGHWIRAHDRERSKHHSERDRRGGIRKLLFFSARLSLLAFLGSLLPLSYPLSVFFCDVMWCDVMQFCFPDGLRLKRYSPQKTGHSNDNTAPPSSFLLCTFTDSEGSKSYGFVSSC